MKQLYLLVYRFRLSLYSLVIFATGYSLFGGIFVYAEENLAEVGAVEGVVSPEVVPVEEQVVPDPSPEVPEPSLETEKEVLPEANEIRGDDQNVFIPKLESREKTKSGSEVDIEKVSGALTYEYKISNPPGRNGLEPDLSLAYNSNDGVSDPSIFGQGWSLNIPSIERMNKVGVNKLYDSDVYSSSFSGELISVGSNVYKAKVESGDFLIYTKTDGGWLVTDKAGLQYKFGINNSSRQDDPQNNSRVFKWMIEEVRDTNDNFIKYSYYKDEGQIYPSEISYTGNGTTQGIFKVFFTREIRNDSPVSYGSSFKVKTNFKISEIRTEVNGSWARKYTLTYENEDNGSGILLDKIVESGKSIQGVVTTLPAIDFDYQKSIPGWRHDPTFRMPSLASRLNDPSHDIGLRISDVNGDGLVDILCHNAETNATCGRDNPTIYINKGNGDWDEHSWGFPTKVDDPRRAEMFADANGDSTSLVLMDVNGDGLPDMVRRNGENGYVYINNGSEWIHNPTWILPAAFSNFSRDDLGVRFSDINGDGLVDVVCHNGETNGYCGRANPEVYLNTGSGWENVPWEFPAKVDDPEESEIFAGANGGSTGLSLIDVNKDGLTDLVRGTSGPFKGLVYLNTGSGWVYDPTFKFEQSFLFTSEGSDIGQRVSDVNGDGLVDVVCRNSDPNYHCGTNNPSVYINKANGKWESTYAWGMPAMVDSEGDEEYFATEDGRSTSLALLDINGDGQDDLVRGREPNGLVYLSNRKIPSNILVKINYPEGGNSTITYEPSATLRDTSGNISNPHVYNIMNLVTKIENNDGLGNTIETQFEYFGGRYYFENRLERKFAGFESIKTIDVDGNYSQTYYHQGDLSNSSKGEYIDSKAKIGRVYRTEVYDSNNVLQSVDLNKWEETAISPFRSFVYLTSNLSRIFDGETNKDKAVLYVYNTSNGNLNQKKEFGEVLGQNDGTFSDTGTDSFITNYAYASNSAETMYLPAKIIVTSQTGVKEKEIQNYYDNLPLGQLTKGNNTKESVWLYKLMYATVEKTYSPYGLIQSIKDPKGKVTNFGFDTYNLYQTTITNPLNFTKNINYNYIVGKPNSIRDENINTVVYIYDGLGRIREFKAPTEANFTPSTHTTYTYSDIPNNFSVKTTKYLSPTHSVSSYMYLDGLGRKIQEKMQVVGGFQTADTFYDNRGNILKISLPYISTDFNRTTPTTDTKLYTQLTYDFASRVSKSVDVIGSTLYTYKLNDEIVTDPLGHVKKFSKDSYGRLVAVHEYLGSSILTTNYTYNYGNNLTRVTDSLNNTRGFSYDGRGLLLRSEDLHTVSDTSFGVHTFSYDLNGNMTNHITPTAIIAYTYNDINQPISEDNYQSPGVDIVYEQNTTCQNGKMRLCRVVAQNGLTTSYNYTKDGQIKSESKTVDGITFTQFFNYDKQGNLSNLTYPDGMLVNYNYDQGGKVYSVSRFDSATSTVSVPIITNITYSPHGNIATINFANGLTQTNTYDPLRKYELRRKNTGTIQDVTYTYDQVGNIKNLVDTSTTNTKKSISYIYDDLDRLLSASVVNVATGYSPFTESFTYNHIGNILSKTGTVYIYSGTGFANPHAPTNIASTTLAYDNSGNLLSEGTRINSWTYKNELASAKFGLNTFTYLYDHVGERVKESGATGTVYTPFNNYVLSGAKKTKNIYLGGLLVSTIDSVAGASSTPLYIISDHLGSTEKVVNQSGAVVEVYDYNAYGKMRVNTNGQSKRRFIGEIYDAGTGYNYLNARYYDSNRGQFISQDPMFWALPQELLLDPQQMNSYSYARNNPINFSDPTGKLLSDYITYSNKGNYYTSGATQGTYNGVAIYSNGLNNGTPNGDYQCPAFVNEFVLKQNNINLSGLGNGGDYGDKTKYEAIMKNQPGSFTVYQNGGTELPKENDIMSWKDSTGSYGHVGIVVQVNFDSKKGTGILWTAEQNQSARRGLFPQEIVSNSANGKIHYFIQPKNKNSVYIPDAFARYNSSQNTVSTKQQSTRSNYFSNLFTKLKSFFKK